MFLSSVVSALALTTYRPTVKEFSLFETKLDLKDICKPNDIIILTLPHMSIYDHTHWMRARLDHITKTGTITAWYSIIQDMVYYATRNSPTSMSYGTMRLNAYLEYTGQKIELKLPSARRILNFRKEVEGCRKAKAKLLLKVMSESRREAGLTDEEAGLTDEEAGLTDEGMRDLIFTYLEDGHDTLRLDGFSISIPPTGAASARITPESVQELKLLAPEALLVAEYDCKTKVDEEIASSFDNIILSNQTTMVSPRIQNVLWKIDPECMKLPL